MGDYPAYPVYQDSEGEWLGFVPAGWPVKRLRFVLTTNPSKHEIDLPADAPVSFVPMEAVGEYGGLVLDTEKPLDEIGSGYTFFAEGDIVVAKITPCFENGKGAIAQGLTNKVAFGTTELHVLRAGCKLHSGFLFYLTISYAFRKIGEAYMYGAGGQKRIPDTFIKDFRLGIPSLAEQQAIARFLDHKTAQIDTLIAKKEALLAKLAEKRTALISHAVTKGLDPTAPMQDSGIDWLGEIPAHWQLKRLRFVLTTNPSKHEVDLPTDAPVSFVPMEAVGEYGGLVLDTEKPLDEIGSGYTFFAEGDIVVAKITPCFENGKGAIAQGLTNKVAFGTTELHVLRPGHELQNRFLFYLTISRLFRKIGEAHMYGAGGQKRVSDLFIKDFQIGIPSWAEQEIIVNFIDSGTAHIDALVAKAQAAIDKLKEYRTALITHAVTGKIDVRGVSLPAVDGAADVARDDVRRQLVG